MPFNLLSKACSSNPALALFAAIWMSSGGPWVAGSHEVASGTVRAVCRLSFGGSFEARSSALSGAVAPSPQGDGHLQGALMLDLQTLETGIGLRDSHLRDYLGLQESGNRQAVLSGIQVDALGERGFASGSYPFRARMRLHGQEEEVAGKVQIRARGERIHATAVFPMRLSDFRIARPGYLGVGVADEITVHVDLTALVKDGSAALSGPMK